MSKISQKDRIWAKFIKDGQVSNFDCLDNLMDSKGRINRLSDIILKLRQEKGHNHILTDEYYNGDNGRNCIYKLNPEIYRKVQINNGVTYFEKI